MQQNIFDLLKFYAALKVAKRKEDAAAIAAIEEKTCDRLISRCFTHWVQLSKALRKRSEMVDSIADSRLLHKVFKKLQMQVENRKSGAMKSALIAKKHALRVRGHYFKWWQRLYKLDEGFTHFTAMRRRRAMREAFKRFQDNLEICDQIQALMHRKNRASVRRVFEEWLETTKVSQKIDHLIQRRENALKGKIFASFRLYLILRDIVNDFVMIFVLSFANFHV
jgi:hypothetical protein